MNNLNNNMMMGKGNTPLIKSVIEAMIKNRRKQIYLRLLKNCSIFVLN